MAQLYPFVYLRRLDVLPRDFDILIEFPLSTLPVRIEPFERRASYGHAMVMQADSIRGTSFRK